MIYSRGYFNNTRTHAHTLTCTHTLAQLGSCLISHCTSWNGFGVIYEKVGNERTEEMRGGRRSWGWESATVRTERKERERELVAAGCFGESFVTRRPTGGRKLKKGVGEGRSGDGEACCCPCVITVPLTMVHFSERGGLEEEVETADTTHPRTDDVTSC